MNLPTRHPAIDSVNRTLRPSPPADSRSNGTYGIHVVDIGLSFSKESEVSATKTATATTR